MTRGCHDPEPQNSILYSGKRVIALTGLKPHKKRRRNVTLQERVDGRRCDLRFWQAPVETASAVKSPWTARASIIPATPLIKEQVAELQKTP